MTRATRQEQARAILQLQAWNLASKTLGRRAKFASDFQEAFNLERIDLISEIPTPAVMMSLGRNVVGPRDGLYVLEEPDGYRVYIQERAISSYEIRGADFDTARDAVIDRLIQLNGIPFAPDG